MPRKIFRDEIDTSEIKIQNNGESFMGTFFKVVLFIGLLVGSFGGGYYAGTSGIRVVDSGGSSLVKSNAAQVVKDENAKMQREVIGKTEVDAEKLLKNGNRTMFVGVRDGKPIEYKGQKTFTNLTLEVKDNKVIKVLGWY